MWPPLELYNRNVTGQDIVTDQEHRQRLQRSASLKEGKNKERTMTGGQNNSIKQIKHKLFTILLHCLIEKQHEMNEVELVTRGVLFFYKWYVWVPLRSALLVMGSRVPSASSDVWNTVLTTSGLLFYRSSFCMWISLLSLLKQIITKVVAK